MLLMTACERLTELLFFLECDLILIVVLYRSNQKLSRSTIFYINIDMALGVMSIKPAALRQTGVK